MRTYLKNVAILISYCLAFPFAALALATKTLFHSASLFQTSAQLLSLVPDPAGSYIRSAYYGMTTRGFGPGNFILFGSTISKMETRIGKGCGIGSFASIGLANIGDKTAIGNHVTLLSGGRQHNVSDPSIGPFERDGVYKMLEIGEKVFIGDRCVVMANVGNSSVVGAGSIVTKDVPDFVVVAGNPARIIKHRDKQPQVQSELPAI